MADSEPQGGRDQLTYAIIGAAIEVHRQLGCGFLEPVYQEALAIEFETRGIPFQREVELPIHYKGLRLKTSYRADFVCYGHIVVELKAMAKLTNIEKAIIINYLKATGYEIGLLLNFGGPSLENPRFIRSNQSLESVKSADDPAKSEESTDGPGV